MGLDINFRFRRIGSKPIGEEYNRPVYNDKDVYDCDVNFQGKSEFYCIRDWVGDDRYGRFIELDTYTLNTLCAIIEQELMRRKDTQSDDIMDILGRFSNTNLHSYCLENLYTFIQCGFASEQLGWILEIECDW